MSTGTQGDSKSYVYTPFILPNDAMVDQATFTLYHAASNNIKIGDKFNIRLCSLLSKFNEETTWDTQPAEGTYCIPPLENNNHKLSWDVTEIIQNIQSSNLINNGFAIKQVNENDPYVFYSRESNNKPTLEIKYHYSR